MMVMTMHFPLFNRKMIVEDHIHWKKLSFVSYHVLKCHLLTISYIPN